MKTKSVFTSLVSLILSHTNVQKLYFYRRTHLLVFLSFSKVIIHQFHSYMKIPTLIPRISNVIALVPTLIPRIPTLIPRITIIPLIPFPDFPFWLLQIANH